VLFALPGLHRVTRGAEVALESIARRVAVRSAWRVTLIGSGWPRAAEPYRFRRAGCIDRRWFGHWPSLPWLRDEHMYEELTFAPSLLRAYTPADYDLTVTCSYPYTNQILARRGRADRRPPHIFITQNGDWPAYANEREFRYFHCDGLVCTNPAYYDRLRDRWRCALIPNGVDPDLFHPGPAERSQFGLPSDAPVALMASALSPSKRVLEGIEAAGRVPDLHLIVAGDGPQRERVRAVGERRMPGRFHWLTVQRDKMPALYRAVDVFLHMSRDEPSANAYLEALATGLPIVTTDRAVTRWTLEDCALLVDTTDRGAVAGALQRALDQRTPQQIEARRALVHRRFTWDQIADQYAAFFDAVHQDRATAAPLAPEEAAA
jgi:glycosyltransferase involved in cell wall biosynthesis